MQIELNRYFNSFVEERVEEIRLCVSSTNKKYKEFCLEASKLKQDVLSNFPKDKKHILLDYENSQCICEGVIHESLYEQGLIDGIKISTAIGKAEKIGN